MSNISYKAYMGKIVIGCTLAMSIVIIVLYSCMVTTCMRICTGVSKNNRILIERSKLILEKYYSYAKFRQRLIIELYTASENKFSRVVCSFGKIHT